MKNLIKALLTKTIIIVSPVKINETKGAYFQSFIHTSYFNLAETIFDITEYIGFHTNRIKLVYLARSTIAYVP